MIFVAEARDGARVEYRDTKRYLWWLGVIVGTLPLGFYLIFMVTDNPLWTIAPFVYAYGFIPLVDWLLGEDPNNPPEEVVNAMAEDPYYDRVLFAALFMAYMGFGFSVWFFATQDLPLWSQALVAIFAGTMSGTALTIGHELGHKRNRLAQWGAKFANGLSWYGHFTQEHNAGHHVHVATPEDSASSRFGESLYAFSRREIPEGVRRGLTIEAEKMRKRGLPVWHWRNEVLQSYAISAVILVLCVALVGWMAIPFLLIHNFFSWQQLTLANYVEHYGLKREKLPNGKYEPCRPRHSWNTNHIFSNLLLFHLQRHSDHHANPLRPYQSLRNFEELPRLPSGYPGCFVLAFFPPLWRRVMDPKVMEWAEGDMSKVNTGPATA